MSSYHRSAPLACPASSFGSRLSSSSRSALPPLSDTGFSIIAICHLSWDWVWQRPQQFLSRLAQRHELLFVEASEANVSRTEVELRSVDHHPGVTRALMRTPASRRHDRAFIDADLRRALQEALHGPLAGRLREPVLWFNDPMAVTAFAGHLGERAIVYDCMDELSQFRGAPPLLSEREQQLTRLADVVFCGGQKMRQKRLPVNPNCHFYGTGVDLKHFAAARDAATEIPPELAAFGDAPVLGYFGVIDERIDYELLAGLADARADWHIAMVGPIAKVDPAEFPRRPNLHWLGGCPYSALPALTKGFSVCLMPFALNPATEYINPTKALEYMAAGKPVVSSALDEVRLNFGAVAHIGGSHAEFIALCERQVAAPNQQRIETGLRLANQNTWDAIAAKMERHVTTALASRSAVATSPPSVAA